MKTFLALVAQDLYKKFGNDLSRIAIVFPNKRARLFFNEELASQSQHPLWSPAYISISELFQSLSPLQTGDSIRLISLLYKVFQKETGTVETLDDFFFWGELLLSDFDDLDKNLVNADQLFTNLNDLRALSEGNDFLSNEQVESIRQFFHNFSPEKRTELKERFRSLWEKLGNIYHTFKQQLQQSGIAYEGMLYRQVLETLDPEELPYESYVFVGFNVLNKVETQLFTQLQKKGKALFYWDYDRFYTTPLTHEAGEFIKRNLTNFPNELPEECFDVMRKPKEITYLSATTENAQARYLNQWLSSPTEKRTEKNTAVVLCNESLLLPVIHSLPDTVQEVNITMGFPITQTPVYGFISLWLDVQTKGYRVDTGRYYHEYIISMLKHPYTQKLSEKAERLEQQLVYNNRFYPLPAELYQDEILELIFTPIQGNIQICRRLNELIQNISILYRTTSTEQEEKSNDNGYQTFEQLYQEALFNSYTLINRITTLIEDGSLQGIKTETLKRLICKLLSSTNIPFHGEPAIGLQIMGVLETRNLDFRNVILLSLNEGKLPKAEGDSSFIPYNLRKAFGMTTIEHKNAVYAYYFYRLIQRAEHVTMMYNTSSDGLNRGEMSRFMMQFLVEAPYDVKRYYLEAQQAPKESQEIIIKKDEELLKRLYEQYDSRIHPDAFLSPSALNTYLDCPLMFYYKYILHLKAEEEISSEIDNALFGTIFHRATELLYTELCQRSKEIRREDIEAILKHPAKIQDFVDKAFKEKFFHTKASEKPSYNGIQLINSKVIASYLAQLLRIDLNYAPFTLEGMEEHVSEDFEIDISSQIIPIKIGGTIDRMDSKNNTLRIVDYKTGGYPKTPENITQLFTPHEDRPNYVFQAFLYAGIMCKKQSLVVAPALLYIHRASEESYSPIIEMGEPRQPKIPINNFSFYEDEFREKLHLLLQEIFGKETAFTQTKEKKRCEYCDYRVLCKK